MYKILQQNIDYLESAFENCGDIVKRKIPIGKNLQLDTYIMYIDMLVDRELIELRVLNPLMFKIKETKPNENDLDKSIFDCLKDSGILSADLKESNSLEEVVLSILSGDAVIFIDGFDKAIIVATKGWPNRGIPSPDTEIVIEGSKEAFNEVFRFNTVLIRRRIRDHKLKLIQLKAGKKSSTDIGVMYLDDLVRKDILDDVLKRIKNINIDAILDSGYVSQLIDDDWASPFPLVQTTERPDKASAAILEGRIVIIVDNSPFANSFPVIH